MTGGPADRDRRRQRALARVRGARAHAHRAHTHTRVRAHATPPFCSRAQVAALRPPHTQCVPGPGPGAPGAGQAGRGKGRRFGLLCGEARGQVNRMNDSDRRLGRAPFDRRLAAISVPVGRRGRGMGDSDGRLGQATRTAHEPPPASDPAGRAPAISESVDSDISGPGRCTGIRVGSAGDRGSDCGYAGRGRACGAREAPARAADAGSAGPCKRIIRRQRIV